MILARLLPRRLRDTHGHLARFRRNPGSGMDAAWLIENAPLFGRAVGIFDDFRAATGPRTDGDRVKAAMLRRVRQEDITPEGCEFLVRHNNRDPAAVHEWLIAGFDEFMEDRDDPL